MTIFGIKMIAILTMLLDHIGLVVYGGDGPGAWLRLAGRLAFPLFCFALTEGFVHTKNRKKYALRLLVFALIAEVPFDWMLYGTPFSLQGQNVLFTLLLGFLLIWGLERFTDPAAWALRLLFSLPFLFAAYGLRTDYSCFGVLMILFFYLFRRQEGEEGFTLTQAKLLVSELAVLLCMQNGVWAALSLLIVFAYNGQRGFGGLRYFFYFFYPLHMLALACLRDFVLM